MRIYAAFILFLAALAPALAQNPAPAAPPQPSHPDFSGTWKLNRAASKVPKGAEAGPETIYIDCMGSMILMGLNGDPSDHWDTFITDGEEHFVAQTQMGATSHTAYWKQFSLITESNLYWETTGDVYPHLLFVSNHIADRWTLSKDGVRLSRSRESWDQPPRLLVYDKQPPLSSQ